MVLVFLRDFVALEKLSFERFFSVKTIWIFLDLNSKQHFCFKIFRNKIKQKKQK